MSVRTAKLLGFYGNGVTRVKVEYVGRAPLEGSDDRKLEATLRDTVPGVTSPVRVASGNHYVPTYFDARPMMHVPSPPNRPYQLGEAEVPAQPAPGVQNKELTAASRSQAAPAYTPPAEAEPSPVSAYAPVRYDGARSGFMSGRGLY